MKTVPEDVLRKINFMAAAVRAIGDGIDMALGMEHPEVARRALDSQAAQARELLRYATKEKKGDRS